VEQPGQDGAALDTSDQVNPLRRVAQRRAERSGLVRAAAVVMALILSQDRAQVPLPIDEQVVQAFATQRANEPLSVGIGLR